MGRQQYERAFYYFRLNQQNYPNSFNVYDSMGDLYVARGDKKKAMESYAKALTLREYPETRQKLEKLQKEK
jgi:predicted negative regulator of RcsB-dependent stress response